MILSFNYLSVLRASYLVQANELLFKIRRDGWHLDTWKLICNATQQVRCTYKFTPKLLYKKVIFKSVDTVGSYAFEFDSPRTCGDGTLFYQERRIAGFKRTSDIAYSLRGEIGSCDFKVCGKILSATVTSFSASSSDLDLSCECFFLLLCAMYNPWLND